MFSKSSRIFFMKNTEKSFLVFFFNFSWIFLKQKMLKTRKVHFSQNIRKTGSFANGALLLAQFDIFHYFLKKNR